MKTLTSFTSCRARSPHSLLLLSSICLMIPSACWGQQQTVTRPRTPRTSRLQTVQLPDPSGGGSLSFENALIQQQQVTVPPSDWRLRFSEIGQLAWAARSVRPAQPSTGAAASPDSSALKMYFLLPDGLYLYNPANHSLQQENNRDERRVLVTAVMKQPGGPTGGAQIVLAGSPRDFTAQYGAYSKTAMLLQAGRTAQNIQLQAISLGLTFVSIEGVNMAGVRQAIRLPKTLEPVYAILVGYPADKLPAAGSEQPVTVQPAGGKVLFVVPQHGFQDQELAETRRAIELAGLSVAIAGTRQGPMTGMLGGTARADLLISQVQNNLGEYSAVVFIGGTGVVEYFNSPAAMNLVRQAAAQRKVLAAIGTAPAILANAGVLRGVRVTAFLSEQARIVQGGAQYTGNPVEKDGPIVTATSAPAAPLFAQAILEGIAETRQ